MSWLVSFGDLVMLEGLHSLIRCGCSHNVAREMRFFLDWRVGTDGQEFFTLGGKGRGGMMTINLGSKF
jgi:hypothetical protein